MRIERFRWGDINSVMEIEKESFQKDFWDGQEFLKWYERCGEGFLVAKENEEIIGYVILEVIEPKKGYIRSIAVKEKYRNKGIGKMLINHIVKNFGLEEVSLHVRAGNGAIDFYRRIGFKEIQRFIGAYPDGEDAIYMIMNTGMKWSNGVR